MGGATAAPAATTMSDGYTDEEADMQRQIDWHARQAKAAKREATATALLVVGEPTEDAIEGGNKERESRFPRKSASNPGKSPAAALSVSRKI